MQAGSMNKSSSSASSHVSQHLHRLPSNPPCNGTRMASTSYHSNSHYSPSDVSTASASVLVDEAPEAPSLGKRGREEELQLNTRVVRQRRTVSGTAMPAAPNVLYGGNYWYWINLLSTAQTPPGVIEALGLDPTQQPINGHYYLGYTRIANTEPAGGILSLLLRNFDDIYLPSYYVTRHHRFIVGGELFSRLHHKENIRDIGGKIHNVYLFIGSENGEPLIYGVYDLSEETPVLFYNEDDRDGSAIVGGVGLGQNIECPSTDVHPTPCFPPTHSPLVASGSCSSDVRSGLSGSPIPQAAVLVSRASSRVEETGVEAYGHIVNYIAGPSVETCDASSAPRNAAIVNVPAIAQATEEQSSSSPDGESSVTESLASVVTSAEGSLESGGGITPDELDAEYDRRIDEAFSGFSSFDELPTPSSELLDQPQYSGYSWLPFPDEGSTLPESSGCGSKAGWSFSSTSSVHEESSHVLDAIANLTSKERDECLRALG